MKNKSVIILYVFIGCVLFYLPLNAQDNSKKSADRRIGISISPWGESSVFRFQSLEGTGSNDETGFFAIGLNYIHGLNQWLSLETGLEYTKYNFTFSPPYAGEGYDYTPQKQNLSLISIPFTAKAKFLKLFFANGGFIFDFDVSKGNLIIDKQSGIGAVLGIGFEYNFDFGLSAYINPYAKIHTLIPFSSAKYHERIGESGIKIGITYNLSK